MANTERLSVTLPAHIVAQVREAVAGGEYVSSNDAISDALVEWSVRRGVEASDSVRLKQAWDQAEDYEGPSVPMDEVMDRLEAKYKALAASGNEHK
jgi:antitoxin ParD1/3/4